MSAKVAELKLNIGQGDEGEDERDEDNDLRDQLQKDWSVRVSSHAQDLRKMDVVSFSTFIHSFYISIYFVLFIIFINILLSFYTFLCYASIITV